jgi:hypothetical protein
LIWGGAGLAALVFLAAWLLLRSPADDINDPKQTFPNHPVRAQLTAADKEYYSKVSRVAVTPTLIVGVELELAQLVGAEGVTDRNPIYSGLMNASAQEIAGISWKGVDRRLVKAAAGYRLARIDEAKLIAQLQLPNMKTVGTKLFVEFLMSLAPDEQGRSPTAGEAVQATLARGVASAADTVKELSAASATVQSLEMAVMDAHTQLLKELTPEESLGVPSYFESVQSARQRLEARTKEAMKAVDKQSLAKALIGRRSAKMDFEFEPGEIRGLEILSQEAKGHCIVTTVKVEVISRFLKEHKQGELRIVHSTLTDGAPEVLFVE